MKDPLSSFEGGAQDQINKDWLTSGPGEYLLEIVYLRYGFAENAGTYYFGTAFKVLEAREGSHWPIGKEVHMTKLMGPGKIKLDVGLATAAQVISSASKDTEELPDLDTPEVDGTTIRFACGALEDQNEGANPLEGAKLRCTVKQPRYIKDGKNGKAGELKVTRDGKPIWDAYFSPAS